MRTILTILLPLIAPFVVFFFWAWVARRRERAKNPESTSGDIGGQQRDWPFIRLALAGGVLAVLTFTGMAMMRDNPMGARYVPPRVENGELVPGHFVSPEENAETPPDGERPYSKTFHGLGVPPPSLPNQQRDAMPADDRSSTSTQ